MKKVKVNSHYIFDPCMWDICDGKHIRDAGIKTGDRVQVVNLSGCPKANVMGHCYIKTESSHPVLCSVHSLKRASR